MKKQIKKGWIILSILIILCILNLGWFFYGPYRYLYQSSHKMDYYPSEAEYEAFLTSFGIIDTDNIISVEQYSYTKSESYLYSYKLDLKVKDIYHFFTENRICEGDVYKDSDGNICIVNEEYPLHDEEPTTKIYTITPDGFLVTYNGDYRRDIRSSFFLKIQNSVRYGNYSKDYVYGLFYITQNEEGDIIISCCDSSLMFDNEFLDGIYDEHYYDDLFGSWIFNF